MRLEALHLFWSLGNVCGNTSFCKCLLPEKKDSSCSSGFISCAHQMPGSLENKDNRVKKGARNKISQFISYSLAPNGLWSHCFQIEQLGSLF